jgi:hypothetical protein
LPDWITRGHRAGVAAQLGRRREALDVADLRRDVNALIHPKPGAVTNVLLERVRWQVLVADARKVKGLAPLACKTDRIDARGWPSCRGVNEPRTVHRLDHRAHSVPREPIRQPAQAVGIRRHRRLGDKFTGPIEQADIEPASTQIQSSVQYEDGPPRAHASVTR